MESFDLIHKILHSKPTDQTTDFPCLPILLSIMESEYAEERSRTEQLDNKAISLLTVIIALITVYVPIFPLDEIAYFYSTQRSSLLIPILFSVFASMGLTAILISIITGFKLITVYNVKNYQAINIKHFNSNEKLGQHQIAKFQIELIDHYQSIILNNACINQEKARLLRKQYKNVITIFILLSVSAVSMLILIPL